MRPFPTIVGSLLCATTMVVVSTGMARGAEPTPVRLEAGQVLSVGGSFPASSEIADVTGDGRNDLIFTTEFYFNPPTDYHLYLFKQRVDGSLDPTPQSFVAHGGYPSMVIATGDLNHDGKKDVALSTDVGVDVLLQSGGTLTAPTLLPATNEVRDVEIVDLNGDDRDDLLYVVLTSTVGSDKYVWRPQLVGGGFGSPITLGTGEGFAATAGDLTGDGLPDVVPEDGGPVAHIYVQQPDHSFVLTTYDAGNTIQAVTIADVTGDGINDLVTAGQDRVAVSAGEGDGTIGGTQLYQVGPTDWLSTLEVADLNGDGHNDIAAYSSHRLYVFLQASDGTIGPPCDYAGGFIGGRQVVGLGDINGDGQTDISAAMVGDTTGSVAVQRQLPVGQRQPVEFPEFEIGNVPPQIGDPVYIQGHMHLPAGGCIDHETVELWRTLPGGTAQKIADVPLSGYNQTEYSFHYEDPATVAGDVSYFARWTGDPIHAPADTDTVIATVGRLTTRLTLKGPTDPISFGATATLKATLHGGETNHKVEFYVDNGSGPVSIGTKTANADGVATLDVTPTKKTTYTADYAGDETWTEATAYPVDVRVRAQVVGRMIHEDGHDRAYAIYRPGSRVSYQTTVRPNHAGDDVEITLQARVSGHWRFAGSQTFTLGNTSKVTISFHGGDLPQDVPLRLHSRFDGDAVNAAATSHWAYFEIK